MNDRSEKEQIEEIRAWWTENGRFVIAGVILGVAAIVGWNQWQSRIEATQIGASNLYEEIMAAVGDGNAEAAEAAARDLYLNYERTVYPDQARLAMARLYMDKGRDQDAADTLRDVLASDKNEEIQMVARLRLAKILLYQDKPGEVIELLKDHLEGGFAARYNEILGDAYAAEGDYAEAQQAYQAALSESRNLRTIDNNLIQLKLNDLPDLTELAEASEATGDEDIVEEATADMVEPAETGPNDDTEPESGSEQ